MYLIEMLSKRYRNRSQRTNILDQLYKDELEPEDRSERLTNALKKKKIRDKIIKPDRNILKKPGSQEEKLGSSCLLGSLMRR